MQLSYLSLARKGYGDDRDLVEGSIKFVGAGGAVELKLTPQHCQKILRVVADALIEQAKEGAAALTAETIEAASSGLLSAPTA
jgi:hypothetical protein